MGNLDLLVDVERQGWNALCAGEAGPYYREHLTEDAQMAFSFGVLAREEAIVAMESAPPWKTFEMQDPRVVALTPESGIVLYRVVASRAGEDPYVAMISSTFVRRDGEWKLAFHQQTPQ
ncbi:MAG: DUF4440 domain-containing protein [Cellulomonas sp.]